MSNLKVSIDGLDRLIRKTDPAILATPLRDFFNRVGIQVSNAQKNKAPVDTGQLRADIQYQVDENELPRFVKIGILNASDGSPLWLKARAMEYGTGTQGDPAVSHKSSHYPPGDALNVWAARHGASSGWAVAKAIARRGGLRPRPYLRPGLTESIGKIREFINRLGTDIRGAWDK